MVDASQLLFRVNIPIRNIFHQKWNVNCICLVVGYNSYFDKIIRDRISFNKYNFSLDLTFIMKNQFQIEYERYLLLKFAFSLNVKYHKLVSIKF